MQNKYIGEQTPETLAAEAESIGIDRRKTKSDYLALAITTCGVGYIPVAPGTFGAIVGVLLYLALNKIQNLIWANSVNASAAESWQIFSALVLTILLTFAGIWASSRAVLLFNDKDPQKAVIDEVLGQLVTFLFVPFNLGWGMIFAGFLLFRLFDIWKPYPIDALQGLPAGIGVVADDLLAGVYAGTVMVLISAVMKSL